MREASISLHSKDAPGWAGPSPAEVGGPALWAEPLQCALFASQRALLAKAPPVPQRKPIGQQRLEEVPLPDPCLVVKNFDIDRRRRGSGSQRVSTGREICVQAPACSSVSLQRPCFLLCDHPTDGPVDLGTDTFLRALRAPMRASRGPAAGRPEAMPRPAVSSDAPGVVVGRAARA